MDPAGRYRGPAFFSQGFRHFFFGASLQPAVAMLVLIGFLSGSIPIPGSLGAVDWPIHSLLFGYAGAVIGGFPLMVIPSWTGRFPRSWWPQPTFPFPCS